MKTKLFALLIIAFAASLPAAAFENLLFRPLVANTFESRVGCSYRESDEKVRLDIGASIDLAEFKIGDDALRIGGDFFTYTRLRTAGNMKFPVETSDYYFGLNASSRFKWLERDFTARLRVAHISSHVVDGLSNDTVFTRTPFVYSREFLDVALATEFGPVRPYIGLCYVFSTKPKDPDPLVVQLGADLDYPLSFAQWVHVSAGYDFKLPGIDGVYTGVHTAQMGLLFKTSAHTGIFAGAYLFDGRSIHGMFYRERDSYGGFGFQLVID